MSIVIIGGGQAALSCAAKFRSYDSTTKIIILGNESVLPYQRPPLSKKYLAGDMALERLFLRPQSWYEKNSIEFYPSCAAVSVERESRSVILEDGRRISYSKLVFATGSRPRLLPETVSKNATNIYAVRSLCDVDTMRHEFQKGRKLLVIGGGYIGLEAASIARKFGLDVTLVEAGERILGRVASKETADVICQMHKKHGVEIIEKAGLSAFDVEKGRARAAKLTNGQTIKVDFVIAGIGILPNSEVAQEAGLACDQGILVNVFCQTSDQNIYAAGDCTRIDYKGESIRIESVGNAIDQGEIVAANLAGIPTPYKPKAWFWSDQYDMTLQIAGLNLGYDDTVTRPGEKEDSLSIWYYAQEQLLAIDALNDPRAYMMGKRLIESGKTVPKSVVSDPETDLKTFLK